MSDRELVVLGTASQVPTSERAHNGYLLRWSGTNVLIDPGEGTQRQLSFAGEGVKRIREVLVTHAHGDHCLGLPGVLQRMSLDHIRGPVRVSFPVEATDTIERLRHASLYHDRTEVVLAPRSAGEVIDAGPFAIRAFALSHGTVAHPVPCLGWRIEEPSGRSFDRTALRRAGVPHQLRAELSEHGRVRFDGRTVRLEEVSRPRPGHRVAVVMDTRDNDGARACAAEVDLLLIEATFLESERDLAEEVGHLTAAGAARIAREVGARRVVLSHFSQRYPSLDGHLAEARAVAPDLDLVVATDLARITFPPRRRPPAGR